MAAPLGPDQPTKATAFEGPVQSAVETADRFRLLVESIKDYALFMLDASGRVSTWNPGAERISGYRAAEIVGEPFALLYPPASGGAVKCDIDLKLAARAGRFEDEGWKLRKDGKRVWVSATLTATRDEQNQLLGFAVVIQDLTARREAEEETRRFRLLVESVKDYAIFILDPNGRVKTWNPGAEQFKGYKAHEIIGKHFSVFYPPEALAEGKCELEIESALRDGRVEDEGWRVRKDGSRFWARVVITTLRDPDGQVIGFAKVTQDLTPRVEAEENRRELAAQTAALAEKARIQQFQERFLAILGHDLRNPLAAIDMGAGILRQQVSDPTALRILDRMHSSSSRMTRMIQQILDLTRSRLANGIELSPELIDMSATLTKIVDEMRGAYPSRSIELDCPQQLGQWDPDRLEQVFSNLVGNAILHGDPQQPVTVRAEVEGGAMRIAVHNEGPPIPPEAQATLFDPFRRGDRDSRTAKTEGLGLGLYISQEIVRGHGGSIEIESSELQGTTFRVTLPLRHWGT